MTHSSIDTSGHPRQAFLYGVYAGLGLFILTFAVNFGWWLLLPSTAPANYFNAVAVIVTSKAFIRYVGITAFWGCLLLLGYPLQSKTFTLIGAALCVSGGLFLALSVGMSSINGTFG